MSKNYQKQTSQRPSWSTNTSTSRTQGEQSLTTKCNYYNKEDGSYGKTTSKETYSSGSYGRGGHKDEYKVTNTYKVGNSKGYSEYKVEEKFRTVHYSDSKKNYSNNNTIIYYDSD